MNTTDASIRLAFDALQSRYIAAVDRQRMEDWLQTFASDEHAAYICNSAENVEGGLGIAWILDDCHARLQDRVTFVTKVWKGTYTPYKTRHVVQCTSWKSGPDETCFSFESNFIVTYTSSDIRGTETLATGVYLDTVRFEADGLKFLKKEVIVDNPILQRYLVFPL